MIQLTQKRSQPATETGGRNAREARDRCRSKDLPRAVLVHFGVSFGMSSSLAFSARCSTRT